MTLELKESEKDLTTEEAAAPNNLAYFKVGQAIKAIRIQRGITQEQLASGLMEVSTLSRIETGKRTPSRATLEAVLQRLGISKIR